MDTIEINSLRIYAYHGVGEQERVVGNLFTLDITLDCDLSVASATDSLSSTINYAEVIDIARQQMAIPSALLEHAAGRIRDAVMQKFPQVKSGAVRIAKLSPPIAAQLDSVAVTLRW